jgi:hypothetical protein
MHATASFIVDGDDPKTSDEIAFLRDEVQRLRKTLNQQTAGLAMLLRRRGFIIYKKEPADDLLIPAGKHVDEYYRMLHAYSFRLFLRDVIKHQEQFTLEQVTRYATPSITNDYLDYLLSIRLIRKKAKTYTLVKSRVTSFGATLEWYIAEICKREFGSESVWGVKFKRPKIGGDYDVIAKLDGSLLYSEVKSSPPRQIYDSEVAAFLDRVADLAPAIAVFFMDTELRMKDKIVPMFEKELQKRYDPTPDVVRMERELFQISNRIFIVNAKESIIGNIERVVSRHYQKIGNLP